MRVSRLMAQFMARLIAALLLVTAHAEARAQAPPHPTKAAALSFAVPGLGQRYVNGNDWNRKAAWYVLAEAAWWAGIVTSQWHRSQSEEHYRTWAASRAGAHVDGKDRAFFVTLGNYRSSDAYRDEHLRNRRWDQLNYVADPAFHWTWQSDADLQQYRDLRQEADAWSRRRSAFIVLMAGSRVVSAVSALRAARRERSTPLSVAIVPGPGGVMAARVSLTL